jgi:hypothetical protein
MARGDVVQQRLIDLEGGPSKATPIVRSHWGEDDEAEHLDIDLEPDELAEEGFAFVQADATKRDDVAETNESKPSFHFQE